MSETRTEAPSEEVPAEALRPAAEDLRQAGRERYRYFLALPTRWMDNDLYGHVNNVIYYSLFDTIINRFLIEEGGLDIHRAAVIGVCAESGCRYFRGFAYPEEVEGALRIARIGRRSVTYQVGLFTQGHEAPAAAGHFVHVFVERESMRPVEIPESLRRAFEGILAEGA